METLYRRFATREGYAYEPVNENQSAVEIDGQWQSAKQEPYALYGIEMIKCALGYHELIQSKKYAHTKYCFRCGKRKQKREFDY